MRELLISFGDALLPLGGAVLLLAFPQWFTKRDLKAPENQTLAKRLKLAGWLLLAAGILVFLAGIGTTLSRT
jgi:hypothetical protein